MRIFLNMSSITNKELCEKYFKPVFDIQANKYECLICQKDCQKTKPVYVIQNTQHGYQGFLSHGTACT